MDGLIVWEKPPPKIVLRNNDLYNTQKIEDHHYEKPEEKDNRVFFNMQNNMQSNMQKEDEMMKIMILLKKEKLQSNITHCINDKSIINPFIFIVWY